MRTYRLSQAAISLRRHVGQLLEAAQEGPTGGLRELIETFLQAMEIEDAVGPHPAESLRGKHDRESSLVARVACARDKAAPGEVLDQNRRRALRQHQVLCQPVQRHAVAARDVMQKLAFMLREVRIVRPVQRRPYRSVRRLKSFSF